MHINQELKYHLADFDFLSLDEGFDDSFLELLCEDGFVVPGEVGQPYGNGYGLWLLLCAASRGFFLNVRYDRFLLEPDQNILRYLQVVRIWNDLQQGDFYLRAPPCFS